MILELEHNHDHQEEQEEDDDVSEYTEEAKPIRGLASVLEVLQHASEDVLNSQTHEEIGRLRRYFEQKVYLSYCDDPSQYLFHMLHKTENETTDHVAQLIMNRQLKVTKAIKDNRYTLKINADNHKIKKMENQLSQKLSDMKANISNIQDNTQLQQKTQKAYQKYMEFRKKGYWKEKSDQSVKVRKFLGKMKKQKQDLEEQHDKNVEKEESKAQAKQLKLKQKQKKEKQQMHKKVQEKLAKAKEERKVMLQEEKKKLAEATSILDKYRKSKRVYLMIEQRYKKEVLEPLEEERRKKLAQIRKTKKPIDAEELQMHQNRYEQFKSKLTQAFEKREQDREIEQKNMEKLKQLYHGRFHQKVEEQMSSYRNIVDEKKRNRQKLMSYSVGVKQQHKPRVDPKKKQELEKIIKLLQIKSNKGKKKKMIKKQDGSIDFVQIPSDQYKKLGISYLDGLRQLNEGVKRKSPEERSASMMELTKKPQKKVYHDYLKQMRTQSRVEGSRVRSKNSWRKIVSQDSFTNRDKYNSVMDHVNLLESEAKQKQIQLKHIKNGTKAIQMKQKLDKYYLESVAAKMHILKEVILKE